MASMNAFANAVVPAEGEREVRDPSRDERTRAPFLEARDRLDERLRELRVLLDARRDGEDVRVEDDVPGCEASLTGQEVVRATEDRDLPVDRLGLALLVERHDDRRRAVAANRPRLLEERLLALFQRDRVHDALPLETLEPGLERREARAVDHDREARGLGLRREQVEEGRHRLLGVEEVGIHVHVEQVRPTAHLLERHVDRALEVVRFHEPPELGRAGDIRPLTDDDETRLGANQERLETGESRQPRRLGHSTRWQALDRPRDRASVLGRGAAAAADDVHEAVLGKRAEEPARVGRLLVVQAERVGEPRVRMAGDVSRRNAGQALEERTHLRRAERAVDADDERLRMFHRDPERVGSLPREVPPALVDRREREPQRQLRRGDRGGHDRGLRVQRVEDGLDQQEVDASVAERADLLLVCRLHRVEGHGSVRGVVDLRRQRERDVQRAYRSGHEPRLLGRAPAPLVRSGASQPRARKAHLGGEALERVVGLPDRGRGEGVRRRDVGARLEVRVVDPGDDLGRGQVQQVRIAFDIPRVFTEALAAVLLFREPAAVDEDAPGPVEDEDPLGEKLFELCSGVRHDSAPA